MPNPIHVYAICYNEAELLPHWLSHYGRIADSITVLDDGSTDGSADILRAAGVEVIDGPFGEPQGEGATAFARRVEPELWSLLNERAFADDERQTIAVVVDIDEFLVERGDWRPERMRERLRTMPADCIVVPEGWNMYAEEWVGQAGYGGYGDGSPAARMACLGEPAYGFCKLSILPLWVWPLLACNYGRHFFTVDPNAQDSVRVVRDQPVLLLHMQQLGDLRLIRQRGRGERSGSDAVADDLTRWSQSEAARIRTNPLLRRLI